MRLSQQWTIAAERAIVDEDTNALSLVACIERVSVVNFPALHHGFCIVSMQHVEGQPPTSDVQIEYRVVRATDADGEETVLTTRGVWRAGTVSGRFIGRFGVLRLRRAERIEFRVDYRIGAGRWTKGRGCAVLVEKLELPPEELERIEAQWKELTQQ